MATERIGIIGAGKMGEAMIAGLIKTGTSSNDRILVGEKEASRRTYLAKTYGITSLSKNSEVAKESSILILCVKPKDMQNALSEVKDSLSPEKILVSLAAGITTKFILECLGERVELIRAMPNNPCTIGEGMTALAAAPGTSSVSLDKIQEIFQAVGKTAILDEELFDAVTALSASGPAYVYLFIEALADAGLKMGIPKGISLALAAQTVLGSAKMVQETGEHPAKLRDLVATPGGTTVCGLYELENAGIRAAVIRAVEKATIRARELSS